MEFVKHNWGNDFTFVDIASYPRHKSVRGPGGMLPRDNLEYSSSENTGSAYFSIYSLTRLLTFALCGFLKESLYK